MSRLDRALRDAAFDSLLPLGPFATLFAVDLLEKLLDRDFAD